MEIKEYKLTKDTSAIVTCIEEVTNLQGNIYEAIALHYDEAQIACGAGVEADKEKIGYKLFEALEVVRDKLFELMKNEVVENLCTTSKEKEI